jgi:hypothetical protein
MGCCRLPHTTRKQPPAGLLVHFHRDHSRVVVDFLTQTTRNPREVSSALIVRNPRPTSRGFISSFSQRSFKGCYRHNHTIIRNPREVSSALITRNPHPTSPGVNSTFTLRAQKDCCRLPHTNHTQPAGGFIRTDRTQPASNLPRVK